MHSFNSSSSGPMDRLKINNNESMAVKEGLN